MQYKSLSKSQRILITIRSETQMNKIDRVPETGNKETVSACGQLSYQMFMRKSNHMKLYC